MIASWQYQIRIRKAAEAASDMFGAWWDNEAMALGDAHIRQITPRTAASVILEYEWLGTMPPFITRCYGLYFRSAGLGDVMGGAIVFSRRMEQNLIDAGTLHSVIPGDAFYLSRGACAYWTPKNSASFLIAGAAKTLGDCSILAYADPSAGEIGTIYQALNWHYLGPTQNHSDPSGFMIDGKFHSTRVLRMYALGRVREAFPSSEVVPSERKHRYVGVYGSKRHKKRLRAQLAPVSKPYQRRSDSKPSQLRKEADGFTVK
jgi:hypothetical protein